jgi:hypothetical protein
VNRSTSQTPDTPDTVDLSDVHAADLFDRTAELLLGLRPLECTVHPSPGDDEGLLLMAATLMCRQFHLVMGLCVSNDDRRAALLTMSGHAEGYHAASPAALGAMSSLLDGVVCNDVAAASATLDSALDVLDVADLFDAAAALMAALTVVIADRLALDPLRVHRETRDAVVASAHGNDLGTDTPLDTGSAEVAETGDDVVDGAATSSESRAEASGDEQRGGPGQSPTGKADWFRGRARKRQTCSGRNSQCHGSRGTASTHPKRGPFVLSH